MEKGGVKKMLGRRAEKAERTKSGESSDELQVCYGCGL